MAEKKKTDKKEKAVVKKAINTKTSAGIKPKKLVEDKYPASEIAKNLNISDFAFLVMKQDMGIRDDTFLTISEFQAKYNKIVGR